MSVSVDVQHLIRRSDARIMLVVIDGLGGIADAEHGTELEEADTPHLDALATESILGLLEPVGAGITPGSGPGHLALFGYDPVVHGTGRHGIGRGALTAAGIGVELGPGDVAARGNLCELDSDGNVVDRRAGRLSDDDARALVQRLADEVTVDGAEVEFHHVKEHRILLVLRGDFDPRLADTDPQRTGVEPKRPRPLRPEAEPTAQVVADVLVRARDVLGGEPANGVLLRGLEGPIELPSMRDRFGVNAAAVAAYPMYRGVASLVGMDLQRTPRDIGDACAAVEEAWDDGHDFCFLHFKDPDKAGEDGDRVAKQRAIEAIDGIVPRLRATGADVIAVSGDHSTPSQLAAHSWHPVPTLIWNGLERDEQTRFDETACRAGALGRRPSVELMPMLLAMAGRLDKFGA